MEWRFAETVRDSIREAVARLNIWHGPVRSGKTIASIVAWLLFIRTAPPGALLMVGKTERTLKRNILDVIAQIAGTKNYRYVGGSGEAFIYGRKVLLVGANDERAEGKIRGLTVAGAYGDELSLWPEGFFRQLLARMSVRGARFFGTTNPDGPYHWLKVNFLDRVGELDLRAFTWPLEHNVALDPAYIAALKSEYGEGSLWFKRFILGLWVAAEGAVYDFFNESEHTVEEVPQPDELFLSVDYGTSNATSVGLYGAYREGQLRAARLRAYYYDGRASGRQKTDSEYAADLDETFGDVKSSIKRVIVDPSAASFKAELRKRGWKLLDANNDVLNGIRTHARMLKSGEFKIVRHPSNMQIIRDYGAYLWDSKAQARGEDKPLKQHDHALDEARYFCHTIFGQYRPTSDDRTAMHKSLRRMA